jgi:hypothetical protein
MSEPTWMQKFSNENVCNFFYFWFVVYAIIFALAVLLSIGTLFSLKKLGPYEIILSLQSVIGALIAGAFMMFHYMICNRALLTPAASQEHKKEVPMF